MPPVKPMLAKAATTVPTGPGAALRAEVGRLPLHRLPRRRRGRARLAQRAPAHPLLPRARRAARRRRCPSACVVDGEIVVVTGDRARLRRPAAAHPPGRRRGCASWPRRRRPASSPSTCSPSATATSPASRSRERRRLLEGDPRRPARAGAPHAGTDDPDVAAGLVHPLRGRRVRRRHGQARRPALPAGQAGDAEGQARAHRRLRGRRLPLAQGRRGRRLAAARPLRRRRRRCTTSASPAASPPPAARSCSTSWRRCATDALDDHPWRRVGRRQAQAQAAGADARRA